MRCLAKLLFILFIFAQAYPQDTTKSNIKPDTAAKKEPVLLSKISYHLINKLNPDTISRNNLLWLPYKNLEYVFQYLPGFYVKSMDIGQLNPLSYNLLDFKFIALLRNDRLMNDLLDGFPDLNLITYNEIEAIETDGFGNSAYNYPVNVNMIQRQVFSNKPFTEVSIRIDRYEHGYVDGNFHKNFFNKLNFNFGITKHSYDGKYTNSDYDKWQGRFNLNYFGSKVFNSFLYVNYTRIQRGLNGGLDPLNNNINNSDSLLSKNAVVRNPDAYEIRTRFDIDLGLLFKISEKKNNYLRLQLFTSNMFRQYRDEENRPNPNGILIKDNSHWIDYGVKMKLVYNFKIFNHIYIISSSEAEYNRDIIHTSLNSLNRSDRIFLKQTLDGVVGIFNFNAFIRSSRFKFFKNDFFCDYGLNPSVTLTFKDSVMLMLFGVYNRVKKIPSYNEYFLFGNSLLDEVKLYKTGIKLKTGYLKLLTEFYLYNNVINPVPFVSDNFIASNTNYYGFNINLDAELFHFNFNTNFNFNKITSSYSSNFYPSQSGAFIISYRNLFFKNKLDLKLGISSRFWGEYNSSFYNGFYNTFTDRVYDSANSDYLNMKIKRDFTLDFFIIAKIDKANFGLAFENLLNRPSYSASVYPYIDRGGLFKFISRFWITWYFFD